MKLVSLTFMLAMLVWVFYPLSDLSPSSCPGAMRVLISSTEAVVETLEKVGELTGPNLLLWCWSMRQIEETMELLDGSLRPICCDDCCFP